MNTELRVGDAERDEVTAALHDHFVQGRLTRDELDERLTATLSAKTVGDLRAVTRDLPGPRPAEPYGGRLPWEAGAAHRARGPWDAGAAHWGRGSLWGRPGPIGRGWPGSGWGPPRHRPFGPLLLVVLAVAAFTGWWVVFPLLAFAWFTAAFTGLRRIRRRHLPIAPRR